MTTSPLRNVVRLANTPAGCVPWRYLNRHGLIAGATGAGKTVTLMRLAEELGAAGIPAILTDVKGDAARLLSTSRRVLPIQRVFADSMPTPLAALGSDIFGRMIGASPAQVAALWALIEDSNCATVEQLIARIDAAPQTVITTSTKQALIRYLRPLPSAAFGSSPSGDLTSLLAAPVVSILDVQALAANPAAYGATMTWLLRSAYERMPEVGDADRPRLALIIDEAHTLFARMGRDTLDEFARVMRLIRSRGVAVFFATQDPTDIPNEVAQHLALRVLHAMRPGNARLAPYFRTLYRTDGATVEGLYNMTPGEALVGGLDANGASVPMARVRILKPAVQLTAPLPPADDEAVLTPVLPAVEARASFGRKAAYGAQPTRAQYREMQRLAEEAGRTRATLVCLGMLVIAVAAIACAWMVKPSPDEAVSIVKLVRGSATALFMTAGLGAGIMALLPLPVVLKYWFAKR